MNIVGRVEGDPPRLSIALDPADTSELQRLRQAMGDPTQTPGRRNLFIQQYRVLEVLEHKRAEEADLLARFLEHIFGLQREYLISRAPGAWVDAPLGTLAERLACPLIALPKLLEDRGIAVGDAVVPLDDLVGVERHVHKADDLRGARPSVLVPTDSMRSRAVVDSLREVFERDRQLILDPVLVVPHPDAPELGYVCEGNHRTAAAHLAGAQVRIRLLKSKEAIQFHLSGTQAARLAASSSYEAFVSSCGEQAARFGYQAGAWDAYLEASPRAPDTSFAVKIIGSADDTSSDALRAAVMELFEGLPGRVLSAKDVEERLVLMGVPKSALANRGRLEVYLRHGLRRVKEVSPGRFTLDS